MQSQKSQWRAYVSYNFGTRAAAGLPEVDEEVRHASSNCGRGRDDGDVHTTQAR